MAKEKINIKFSKSLRLTIALTILAMMVCIVLIVGFAIYFNIRDVIRDNLEEHGFAMARNLGHNSAYAILVHDGEELGDLIHGMEVEKNISYIIIYDDENNIVKQSELAEKLPTEFKQEVDFEKIKIAESHPYSRKVEINNEDFLDIFVHVHLEEGKKAESYSTDAYSEMLYMEMDEAMVEEKTEEGNVNYVGAVRLGISLADVKKATHVAWGLGVVLIVAAFIFGGGLILYLMKRLVDPIINLSELMRHVKSGDMTVRAKIHTHNELGELEQSFNEMLQEFEAIIAHVLFTSGDVASTSEELSAATQEITSSTEEVAISIEQIASGANTQSERLISVMSASERISSSARRMAENATLAEKVVTEISQSASSVRISSEETLTSMIGIADATSQTVEKVNQLGEKSQKIGKIIETIADISQQTNLLSLNAGIEAARAGEHGLGFKVLAREIRGLADKTKQEAEEISRLIKEMQVATEGSVKGINEVAKEVKIGEEKIKMSSNVLIQIADDVESSTTNVKEIAQASVQQQQDMEQLVKEIETVATIAENNAANSETVSSVVEEQNASMEEMNSSSQMLAAKAEELRELVKKFRVTE